MVMDQKMLKLIGMGACAYFLIVDGALSFLLETWYTSMEAGLFLSAAACFLMLVAGFVILKKYREERHADQNGLDTSADSEGLGKTANSGSLMIGGAAILIITGQLLLRILLMWLRDFSWDSFVGGLFFHLLISAFAVAGVISLWKGLEGTQDQLYAAELRVLCYRSS
jgi:4-hydroxybenzoate polyprenyltransferase